MRSTSAVRDVHRAAHVLNRRLRRHRAERDDLRHIVAPIFLRDVVDHLAAPVHAEIDVDIRHRHALRIQKALEQQLMLQRVEIGNSQRVGNQRPGSRSAPRPHRNVVFFRITDEVPHNQKISGELHLLDDCQFPLQPLFVIRNRMLQLSLLVQRPQRLHSARKAFARNVLEITVDRITRRNLKLRKRRRYLFQPQAAALGDVERARQNLRRVLEHAIHLVA